jgi:hypothetical protein
MTQQMTTSFHNARRVQGISTVVTITHLMQDNAGAIGIAALDGRGVFISGRTCEQADVRFGDTLKATIYPNTNQPEKTPWFARNLVRMPGEGVFDVDRVLKLLVGQGGTWTAEDVATEILDRAPAPEEIGQASLALDFLYHGQRGVAKFVLFMSPVSGGAQTWFTAFPDNCDVVEIEEDEE